MESLVFRLFLHNWQRKVLALATAIVIWFFVSHSITETKMIRNVPIRISNLPADKTVVGLLPNGILQKRINLTLGGAKDVIEEIEPGDLEVNIDASTIDHADWIVQIGKKNLVSLNPDVDIANSITSISHSEFVIKLNRLVMAKIPVDILPPEGEAPAGYEFLDIWPQRLMQMVSGPEEEVNRLKANGLKITFDLSDITKADLDAIKSQQQLGNNNEISFSVPYQWKQVAIPFRNHAVEELNDPEAQFLRIAFLRQELLPVERQIPVTLFYPVRSLNVFNPTTLKLAESDQLINKEGIFLFTPALQVSNVSRLFLDIVRDYLQLTVVAIPKSEREVLPWSLEIITPHELEDMYVAYQIAHGNKIGQQVAKKREMLYRMRFREYLQKMALYISTEHKLNLESVIHDNTVHITDY